MDQRDQPTVALYSWAIGGIDERRDFQAIMVKASGFSAVPTQVLNDSIEQLRISTYAGDESASHLCRVESIRFGTDGLTWRKPASANIAKFALEPMECVKRDGCHTRTDVEHTDRRQQ